MSAQTYFTGKPCKRGHVAERFVSTRNCVECNRERGRLANMSDTAYARKLAGNRTAYWRNPDRARAMNREAGVRYYEQHKKKILAETRLYQVMKHQRIPKWADLKAIRRFYEACPKGYEVDHIIPLMGKNVCGLHVLENLQYLTIFENRSKGNNF